MFAVKNKPEQDGQQLQNHKMSFILDCQRERDGARAGKDRGICHWTKMSFQCKSDAIAAKVMCHLRVRLGVCA